MKRLATATVLLTALVAGSAQAGSLPKPLKMSERMKMYSVTHFVRGAEKGKGHGGGGMTAEARQTDPVQAPDSKPKPAPQRAD